MTHFKILGERSL